MAWIYTDKTRINESGQNLKVKLKFGPNTSGAPRTATVVIKNNEQEETCEVSQDFSSVNLYWNTAISRSATKTCPAGQTGGSVTVSVPARKYFSFNSQAEAEALAEAAWAVLAEQALANIPCVANQVCQSAITQVFYKSCTQGDKSATYTLEAFCRDTQEEVNAVVAAWRAEKQQVVNDTLQCDSYTGTASSTFTRNDCGEGSISDPSSSGTVSYSDIAQVGDDISSTESQAAANAKALAYLNQRGQAYANSNFGCVWQASYTGNVVPQCESGETAITQSVTISKTSNVSYAAAQAAAQAAVEGQEGQAIADARQGACQAQTPTSYSYCKDWKVLKAELGECQTCYIPDPTAVDANICTDMLYPGTTFSSMQDAIDAMDVSQMDASTQAALSDLLKGLSCVQVQNADAWVDTATANRCVNGVCEKEQEQVNECAPTAQGTKRWVQGCDTVCTFVCSSSVTLSVECGQCSDADSSWSSTGCLAPASLFSEYRQYYESSGANASAEESCNKLQALVNGTLANVPSAVQTAVNAIVADYISKNCPCNPRTDTMTTYEVRGNCQGCNRTVTVKNNAYCNNGVMVAKGSQTIRTYEESCHTTSYVGTGLIKCAYELVDRWGQYPEGVSCGKRYEWYEDQCDTSGNPDGYWQEISDPNDECYEGRSADSSAPGVSLPSGYYNGLCYNGVYYDDLIINTCTNNLDLSMSTEGDQYDTNGPSDNGCYYEGCLTVDQWCDSSDLAELHLIVVPYKKDKCSGAHVDCEQEEIVRTEELTILNSRCQNGVTEVQVKNAYCSDIRWEVYDESNNFARYSNGGTSWYACSNTQAYSVNCTSCLGQGAVRDPNSMSLCDVTVGYIMANTTAEANSLAQDLLGSCSDCCMYQWSDTFCATPNNCSVACSNGGSSKGVQYCDTKTGDSNTYNSQSAWRSAMQSEIQSEANAEALSDPSTYCNCTSPTPPPTPTYSDGYVAVTTAPYATQDSCTAVITITNVNDSNITYQLRQYPYGNPDPDKVLVTGGVYEVTNIECETYYYQNSCGDYDSSDSSLTQIGDQITVDGNPISNPVLLYNICTPN